MRSVERAEEKAKELGKALNAARVQLLDYQVEDWLAEAERIGAVQVVCRVFADYDVPTLREVGRRLI